MKVKVSLANCQLDINCRVVSKMLKVFTGSSVLTEELDISSTIYEMNDRELKNGRRGHLVSRNSYCIHFMMRCTKLMDCKVVFGCALESVFRSTRGLLFSGICSNEPHINETHIETFHSFNVIRKVVYY